jgi:hypothetical protein
MFKTYEQLQERLNMVLNLKGGHSVEKVTETLAAKPDFSEVSNMNLKPTAVPVQEAAISTDDQPESEDDVMDYFRKLADS